MPALGASSVMIATAAEANPSCFALAPLQDVETTLIPPYLRLVSALKQWSGMSTYVSQCKYLDNHWALTKFCISQFKGIRTEITKDEAHKLKSRIIKAKGYDEVTELVGSWTGDADLGEIVNSVHSRRPRPLLVDPPSDPETLSQWAPNWEDCSSEEDPPLATPPDRPNPEPPTSCAPLGPSTAARMPQPALITGSDLLTPTPTPRHVSPFSP